VTKLIPESGLLVTGGSTDRIRVWDLRKEQMVRIIVEEEVVVVVFVVVVGVVSSSIIS